jgi:hypothetical protein
LPSPLDTLLTIHFTLLITIANTSTLWNALAAPNPHHQAAAAPMKPLDNLLHLPIKAAPVQEAINLVEDKPLKDAVTLE